MNNNMPMTLEEVRQLKSGDTIYLKQYKTLISREVSCVFAGQIVFVNDIRKYLFSYYGKTWLCYRTKEDEERKECLSCKGTYFQDIGFDIDCEARGIELNYCPECGRKLHD